MIEPTRITSVGQRLGLVAQDVRTEVDEPLILNQPERPFGAGVGGGDGPGTVGHRVSGSER